jgi:hypothetical protein
MVATTRPALDEASGSWPAWTRKAESRRAAGMSDELGDNRCDAGVHPRTLVDCFRSSGLLNDLLNSA